VRRPPVVWIFLSPTRTTPRLSTAAAIRRPSQAALRKFVVRSRRPPPTTIARSFKERLAKLVGGVAVIKVCAATETEMKEKKARVVST
jgi:hypothetical protein